jgi:hypothetical protein
MIVSIHQPHFMPWMGYINKVLYSDVFIWLNTVQFRKNYFQNRTKIKGYDNKELWITIPVHAGIDTRIKDVVIVGNHWETKMIKTIESIYKKARYFDMFWTAIRSAIIEPSKHLDELNFRVFKVLLKILSIDNVVIIKADEILVNTEDPTRRLVELCRYHHATHYIAGRGGKNYLDVNTFKQDNITVVWQNYSPDSIVYAQLGKGFIPGLSTMDCIFNVGPEKTKELIKNAWIPQIIN